jgi:predicted transcriptional regulator
MGEKPQGRILVVMGVLFASLFVGFASADVNDVHLELTFETDDAQAWVGPGNPLVLTPALVNEGEAVTLPNNPKCTFVINVFNVTGVKVVDGTEGCPAREQGLDLTAGETYTAESPLTWTMKDADGAWLESGSYTVEAMHVGTGLSTSTSVLLQTPVNLPSALTYTVDWVQRLGDGQGAWVGLVSLHNPSAQTVDLSELSPCAFEYTVGETTALGPSCIGEQTSLMPGEVVQVDQLSLSPSSPTPVRLALSGGELVHERVFEPLSTEAVLLDASLSLSLNANEERPFGQGDVLVAQLDLLGSSGEDQTLTFTSSCRSEMWVLNDLGEVVFDSRSTKSCQPIELETSLSSTDPLTLTLPQWNFFDSDGCRVSPGTYTVVAEVPELQRSVVQTVAYRDASPNPCDEGGAIQLVTEANWLDANTLQLTNTVTNTGPEAYLRMTQPCSFVLDFLTADEVSVHRFQGFCGSYDGRKVLVPQASEGMALATFEVNLMQDGAPVVPEGIYELELNLLANPTSSAAVPVAWPQDFTESSEEVDTESPSEPVVAELTGTWIGLLTEEGTCYVLDMDGEMHLLAQARTLADWTPSSTTEGIYRVVPAPSSPACASYSAASFEVIEVVMERSILEPVVEDAPVETQEVASNEDVSLAPVASVVTVVVTTSLLSLLVVVVATNEGLRLPTTVAGLWLLGLVGKTHETTDGRYQRGRLMGYLTANPGCHFRALMSALDMSNGQITHHLRILEAEENVWRKNDGRLVRYYPLTNQLNPSTSEEDLPVPPLSPDPNSLQGKILNLLDQDGDLGQFPTQAELAKRLEKSQQLVSHHLRTLQKYGLVERRKMGLMNRYKLTREAIFLLETSDDFGSN